MSFTLLGILNAQAAAAGGAGAYDLLETQVLSSSASSVTFTGLDSYSDYKHLQVRYLAQTSSTFAAVSDQMNIRFNGVSSSVYTTHYLRGSDSGVQVSTVQGLSYLFFNASALRAPNGNAFGGGIIDILDFADSNKNTTTRALTSALPTNGDSFFNFTGGLFEQTSAISSMQFFEAGGDSLLSGSRFSIYGIKG